MSKKPSKKRLYHLEFNTIHGTVCYNLFIENNLIIKIELITNQKFDYYASLCTLVSEKDPLPCSIEIFNKWLLAVLNKCNPLSLIDYNIHSTNRAMLRKTKGSKLYFSKK